jgi:hypothetical protein
MAIQTRFCLLSFALLGSLLSSSQAATVSFSASGTVTNSNGTSSTVSASATFTTMQDVVVVTIMNNITGASRILQGISGVDFGLTTGQTTGSILAQAGLVRTINSDGTWSPGDTGGARPADFGNSGYVGEWALQASGGSTNGLPNSLSLTTLNGDGASMTILGPSTNTAANCCYNAFGAPNSALLNRNPFLVSDGQPVTFTLAVPGVSIGTTLFAGDAQMRFFFGKDRSAYLDGSIDAPESGSFLMIGAGLILLPLWNSRRRRRA